MFFACAAFRCRAQGDLQGAIREYTKALAVDPKHFKSMFNRGFMVRGRARSWCWVGRCACRDSACARPVLRQYMKGHKYNKAIADFRRASELEPSNAFARCACL